MEWHFCQKPLLLALKSFFFIILARESDLPLIVAIDLQPMAPIEGVIQVQGDITNARTAEVVCIYFSLVLSSCLLLFEAYYMYLKELHEYTDFLSPCSIMTTMRTRFVWSFLFDQLSCS